MSTKSLVSAKVLGGGIAGASGVVGTGYGITRCLKSEEATTTETSESVRSAEQDTHTNPSTEVTEGRGSSVELQGAAQSSPSANTLTGGQEQSRLDGSSGSPETPANTVTEDSQKVKGEGDTDMKTTSISGETLPGVENSVTQPETDGQQSDASQISSITVQTQEGQAQALPGSPASPAEKPASSVSNSEHN